MDPFLGEIRLVGFNFAPVGWALCDGQIMSIAQNTALFTLLGTFYGGDGVTTFALPNLQSRVPIHMGQGTGLSPYTIGQVGGEENVTLQVAQIPGHTHVVAPLASEAEETTNRPIGAFPTRGGVYATSNDGTSMGATTSSSVGNSQPHDNRQPYLVLNYIIALQGIFPSRS